ncbi:hypothetical protein, partial [Parageobacillus thermoglucosidasius]|uniref:hypothetical protein n=1 Tax=Parageobacillus thermoglucosidasius TaxID=1426 RepID=UPI00311968F7|nr:hypothetical protein [Parageobacillus thermoglucosidasius]
FLIKWLLIKMEYYCKIWKETSIWRGGDKWLTGLRPIKNGGVVKMIGSTTDIRKRKTMEKAVIHAKERSEKANQAKFRTYFADEP